MSCACYVLMLLLLLAAAAAATQLLLCLKTVLLVCCCRCRCRQVQGGAAAQARRLRCESAAAACMDASTSRVPTSSSSSAAACEAVACRAPAAGALLVDPPWGVSGAGASSPLLSVRMGGRRTLQSQVHSVSGVWEAAAGALPQLEADICCQEQCWLQREAANIPIALSGHTVMSACGGARLSSLPRHPLQVQRRLPAPPQRGACASAVAAAV